MKKIAKFEKVSYKTFLQDLKKYNIEKDSKQSYENIFLPCRATKEAAGYDIFSPIPIDLSAGATLTIPTGIRAKIKKDWALFIIPKSGIGFKFKLQLNNTIGLIDSDYYYAENEGHIIIKITNDNRENKTLQLEAGKAFVQGVFLQYGICVDDNVKNKRKNGLGSTNS